MLLLVFLSFCLGRKWPHANDTVERATGIEPASEAWEASILPMNYARKACPLPYRYVGTSAKWRQALVKSYVLSFHGRVLRL